MNWIRVDLPCPMEAADVAAAIVLAETGRGASVVEQGSQALVQGWVPEEWRAELCARLRRRLQAASADLAAAAHAMAETPVDDEDWSLAWRRHFHPFRVGERLVVKPTWEPWPPSDRPSLAHADDLVLEIDPGGAFGTGTHPSTQLALRALERHVRDQALVVDVGCGSGILSTAALRLGAQHVVALDFDAAATDCTRRNLRAQGLAGRASVMAANGLSALRVQADLIVANISAEAVLRVARQAAARLRPGGRYVAAGFLETDLPAIEEALEGLLPGAVTAEGLDGWASATVSFSGCEAS